MPVAVAYAGKQPEFAGLDQINAELPRSLAGAGTVTVLVTVDGRVEKPSIRRTVGRQTTKDDRLPHD